MKERKFDADLFAGGLLILASLFFYYWAGKLPHDAAMWPKMILIVTLSLAVLLLISGIRRTMGARGESGRGGLLRLKLKELGVPVVVLIFMSIYAVIMDIAGFFIATAIFLPLSMASFRQRSLPVLVGVTVGIEVFVYWLFVMQLNLRMP